MTRITLRTAELHKDDDIEKSDESETEEDIIYKDYFDEALAYSKRLPLRTADRPERVVHVFSEGDFCYSWWGGTPYKAQIWKRDVAPWQQRFAPVYFVRYPGFRESWNGWVDETDLQFYDDKGKTEKEVNRIYEQMRAPLSEEERKAVQRRWNRIFLPETAERQKFRCYPYFPALRTMRLWFGYDADTAREKRLLKLPRPVPVRSILRIFARQHIAEKKLTGAKLQDFMRVLTVILKVFDRFMLTHLCYKYESANAWDVCVGKQPSEVFGAEHLLRCLARWPLLISMLDIRCKEREEHGECPSTQHDTTMLGPPSSPRVSAPRPVPSVTDEDVGRHFSCEHHIITIGDLLINYVNDNDSWLMPADHDPAPEEYLKGEDHVDTTLFELDKISEDAHTRHKEALRAESARAESIVARPSSPEVSEEAGVTMTLQSDGVATVRQDCEDGREGSSYFASCEDGCGGAEGKV